MRRATTLLGLILSLVGASPAYAANGVVASWPFDEGSGTMLHDTSGNGNNGVVSGDAQWVSGFKGSALSFDGNTGRVRVRDSLSLDPASAVSVSAWIRATVPQGDFNYILAKGAAGCLAASYGLYTGPNGGVMFYVARNTGASYTRSPDGGAHVWNGSWHLVVGTYDGSSVRLYVDGSQIGNGSPQTGPIDYNFPDNDLFIGHYNTCPTLDFHGQIDMAQVWTRALTASEVRTSYDQLTGAGDGSAPSGTPPTATAPSPTSPSGSTPSAGGPSLSSPLFGRATQSALSSVSMSGLSNGTPRLVVRFTARRGTNPVKSLTVSLPTGLQFARSRAQLRTGVSLAHRPNNSISLNRDQLVVVFKQPQRTLALTIGGSALTETASLAKRVRAVVTFNRTKPQAGKQKVLVLKLGMGLTDAKHKSAVVHAVFRVT